MEKFVYQMFILGTGFGLDKNAISNCKASENLKTALKKGLGGVIFFTKDIDSQSQFQGLISDIKSNASAPVFLSIDQEGGRVERTEKIHERYLSPRYAFEKGEEFLRQQAETIAEELSGYGINLNFAPCADVNTNPNNPIIGERAFSNNPSDVIKGVEIVSDVFKKYGIISCIKHFPGHGDADKDSHLTLPVIDLPMEEMEKVHILPFKRAIEKGVPMIMAAHLHCTCFDKEQIPASLSFNAIGYLRDKLNYNGVVITDDMVMKGVQNFGVLDACKRAILSGVDMFVFRDVEPNVLKVIEDLAVEVEQDIELKQKVMVSYKRIMDLKKVYL